MGQRGSSLRRAPPPRRHCGGLSAYERCIELVHGERGLARAHLTGAAGCGVASRCEVLPAVLLSCVFVFGVGIREGHRKRERTIRRRDAPLRGALETAASEKADWQAEDSLAYRHKSSFVSNTLYSLLCLTGDFVTQSASSHLTPRHVKLWYISLLCRALHIGF